MKSIAAKLIRLGFALYLLPAAIFGQTRPINNLVIENSGAAITGIAKANGSAAVTAAVAGTDYAPATTGSAVLKASAGGFAAAVANSDYAAAPVATVAALKALSVSGLSTGYQVRVLGYYAAGDAAGTRTYVYNSGSSTADNGGTVIAPTSGSGRWLLSYSGPLNVAWFGAKIDGTTDDNTAMDSAVSYLGSVNGGTLYIPSGTCVLKGDGISVVNSPNIEIKGAGINATVISFQPASPATHWHAVEFGSSEFDTGTITSGAIALGSDTFTVSSASNLIVGDWLELSETDTGISATTPVVFDWVKIAGVSGTTITTSAPIPTAFSGAHSTTVFTSLRAGTFGDGISDLSITTTDTVDPLTGIYCLDIGDVSITRVNSSPAYGAGFDSYRSRWISVNDCTANPTTSAGNEFSSTVDFRLTGDIFTGNTASSSSDSAALAIDYGSARFAVAGCVFGPAGNINVELTYGDHDGSFTGNHLGYVYNSGTTPLEISGIGNVNVTVSGNSILGGDSGCTGVNFWSTSGWV